MGLAVRHWTAGAPDDGQGDGAFAGLAGMVFRGLGVRPRQIGANTARQIPRGSVQSRNRDQEVAGADGGTSSLGLPGEQDAPRTRDAGGEADDGAGGVALHP